jgi:tripartite tricarboxylate transporter TctB family protein
LKRLRQAAALIVTATGVFLVLAGMRLRLEGPYGPGPGFLAFWVGLALAVLGPVWLVQVSLVPPTPAPASAPGGPVRVASILLALVTFAVLLAPLGFTLVMLGLLLGLFFAYDREHALAKVVVALVGSAGTHYVFERLLRVPLPDATVPALRSLGF